jgi:ABC-type multidrug transport system ATPase subunit
MAMVQNSTSAILDVENLKFSYDSDAPLFDGLSFYLSDPGFYSIFGRSGSGKSTLGRIIAGRLPGARSERLRIPTPALYVSSDEILPHWVLVSDHLKQFLPSGADNILRAYWEVAELGPAVFSKLPPELSLGQRQRVNLARYLVRSARSLVLDEVLIGVDQPTRWKILKWIKSERVGMFTFLISHEIDDVAIFSKQILTVHMERPVRVTLLDGSDLSEPPEIVSAAHSVLRTKLANR